MELKFWNKNPDTDKPVEVAAYDGEAFLADHDVNHRKVLVEGIVETLREGLKDDIFVEDIQS